MVQCHKIEWLFEENDDKLEEKDTANIANLDSMSLAEELREIAAPLTHPIGAASIQIIAVSAGLEYAARYSSQYENTGMDTSNGRCQLAGAIILVLFTCFCIKYRLSRFAVWTPMLLIALAAWLSIEWSLFPS